MKQFLDYASSKYYAGDPIISDEEFDRLADYFKYESVGATVESDSVAHAFPMWSLQKCYTDEPLIQLNGEKINTPKLDGAAIALYYVYGTLSLSLTRGDGKRGVDVTEKVQEIVPVFISNKTPILQVVGEVVAPKHIENARNYAAGALNLKDVIEFSNRDIHFIAYGLNPTISDTWYEDMGILETYGFKTVTSDGLEKFPTDGIVYRLNNYKDFKSLGYTSKHPRGAFALKERKGGVITRLKDVEWQVGRSGVVSPVAILEPIDIGGAKISRATLHNIKYIEELDLDIGCLVEVVRSGEIIPRVVKRVYE